VVFAKKLNNKKSKLGKVTKFLWN